MFEKVNVLVDKGIVANMNYALKVKYILSFENSKARIVENGIILVDGNRIVDVGNDLPTSGREIFEFPNHVVLPGLVNTHSHLAMTLFRGFADDIPLNSWLNDHIWPMEAKLKSHHVEHAAKLAAVELIQSGTTMVNSMYWHPESELTAFNQSGVRILSGPPIISGISDLNSNLHLIEKWHGKNDDLTRIALNPHSPYTVTAEDFERVKDYKNHYNEKLPGSKLKLHTHVSESKAEMGLISNFIKERDQNINFEYKSPVDYLDKLRILDEDTIAAHVVNASKEDLDLLGERNVGISINTVSNLKLGNGSALLPLMSKMGLNVGLGTDGPATNNGLNMFETMKMSTITQKGLLNDPTILPAEEILRMATLDGAKILGWNDVGNIKPNYKADLIFIDLNKPHLLPIINHKSIMSLLVYSIIASDVSDVMINGNWKMRNRELIGFDLSNIMSNFKNAVNELFSDIK